MIKLLCFIVLGVLSLALLPIKNNSKSARNDKSILSYKAQDTLALTDGPYLLFHNDTIIEKNIFEGVLESKILDSEAVTMQFFPEPSIFNKVSKIAALSDIHGQFDLATVILKNNGIIDTDLNWSFGNGHLVIVGDIFDRGPKVTELLWFVYKLEQQAIEKGGRVHFVLGNHEYMVMHNDLRYVNKKYRRVAQALRTPYSQLYDEHTLLGRWLRSKPTLLKINDNLFVHGGISKDFVHTGFDLEETNKIMRQSLYEEDWSTKSDSIYGKYYDSFSPIWYRGYFNKEFKKSDINRLLRVLKVKHIIVGHTSFKKIESLFDSKIIAVDSSIKNGTYGELLLIEDGNYYRGTMSGLKIKLK
ncbi:metallophosphoesterase [Flavobacteriaceae bacterium LMO-SS05]